MKRILKDICLITHGNNHQDEEDNKAANHWKVVNFVLSHSLKSIGVLSTALIPIFVVMEKLDMFYSFQVYMAESRFCIGQPAQCQVLEPIMIIFRYGSTVIGFLEGVRIYGISISALFYWLEMQSKYFRILRNSPQKEFRGWYAQSQIVSQIFQQYLNTWIKFLLVGLFVIIVICNVVSIKYFGELPLLVYWFMPMSSAFNCTIVYFAFPFLVECHELTKGLLRESKLKAGAICKTSYELKVALRELKAMRPISIKFGSSFVLKGDTKSTFYDSVVQRTLDGILI